MGYSTTPQKPERPAVAADRGASREMLALD
jgi:hypothetical protein